MKRSLLLVACGALALCGCVQNSDVREDARLRGQAMTAFAAGDFRQTRAIIERADTLYVPQGKLWKRTLELRMALAENARHGELAELALAEALSPAFAADWLYDMETADWPQPLRTRYNLLRAGLQQGQAALHDDTVARWRLGVRGLYDSGRLLAAANEAARCANETHNAEAALMAAKLYNEAGDAKRKGQALTLAEALAKGDATLKQEIGLVRTAPLGEKSAF